MKIVFTAGGSGGHFYPVIAVVEAVHDLVREKKLVEPELFYAAPEPFDADALFANSITYIKIPAGKLRRYFSLLNITDGFKTLYGFLRALSKLYTIYPDVVFGAGGYGSFPTLLAARILRIPVVIYATDAEPSLVNRWAGKFAVKIAISFPEAAPYFKAEKVALTGNPIRKNLLFPAREGAHEFLKLDPQVPIILVIGGSLGSMAISDVLLAALPTLVEKYQIIHQTGPKNFEEVEGRSKVALEGSSFAHRYKPFPYLNELATRMSAGVAQLVVSRAGAGSIFEIAAWGVPAILIPIPESISHDQTRNAFSYARTGAAVVVEQNNFTPSVLISEIARILEHPEIVKTMRTAAHGYARADGARVIGDALLSIALSHER